MKHRIFAAVLTAVFLFSPIGSVMAQAGGGPSEEEPAPVIPVFEEAPEEKPFTPAGTATVIDNATSADGKEFYTIMTPNENVFYLIIDRQREQENVYFLNAVTEQDLLALAVSGGNVSGIPDVPVTPPIIPDVEPEPTPEPKPEKSGGMGTMLLLILIVLGGGGAGWYFKIYRPKQQAAGVAEDFDEDYTAEDYEDDYSDSEDMGDDSPPWDVDDEAKQVDDDNV